MSILKKNNNSNSSRKRNLRNQCTKNNSASVIIKTDTEAEHQSSDEINTVNNNKIVSGSFNWRSYLRRSGSCLAAPLSCFKHVPLSSCWEKIMLGAMVEIHSPDCKNCSTDSTCCYWIASIIKVAGFWGLLRYEGYDTISPRYFNIHDKWVNLCTESSIHPLGWCTKNDMPLVPPKNLEPKIICWKSYLTERLIGARTLPSNFDLNIEKYRNARLKKGMRLEVVDKNLISAVRSAIVNEVVGGRLHIKYAENDVEFVDEGFWCHENSSLIHPVGWAQITQHALKSSLKYARQSLKRTLYRTFHHDDATWDLFIPVQNPSGGKVHFSNGMKLEAIDPLNLSTICVATVMDVLENNYLMIGIDGMMAPNGADWFCYHATSPCIFPVGFCDSFGITLTPPRGYKGEFKWSEYLKKTKSQAAPYKLFDKEISSHGYKAGMYLEAVDLMEPRLVCVAKVVLVVGRLLKVHFEGWEEEYDQWCDCTSPDLFPIGWCQANGYPLEPPRPSTANSFEDKKKKKPFQKKRGKKRVKSKKNEESFDMVDANNVGATDDGSLIHTVYSKDADSSILPVIKRKVGRPKKIIKRGSQKESPASTLYKN